MELSRFTADPDTIAEIMQRHQRTEDANKRRAAQRDKRKAKEEKRKARWKLMFNVSHPEIRPTTLRELNATLGHLMKSAGWRYIMLDGKPELVRPCKW